MVGATGVVGQELLRVLAQRHFPIRGLKALASGRSAGTRLPYNGGSVEIEELTEASFAGIDVAFFAVGSAQSLEYAPAAVEAGALVIVKSAPTRRKENVPHVMPHVTANLTPERASILVALTSAPTPPAIAYGQRHSETVAAASVSPQHH